MSVGTCTAERTPRTSVSYQILERSPATSGVQAFRVAFATKAAAESGISLSREACS
jgi:hypothetical protein